MEESILQETVKKSEFHAKTSYDYKWLTYSESYFLAADITEEKEELVFSYHTEGRRTAEVIREEDLLQRPLILESVGGLFCARKNYDFSLKPGNLYYDEHGSVKIKRRDICQETEADEAQFIQEYKAVIGYALQRKYTYEDFVLGGLDLLGKDGILGTIKELQTVDEIREALLKEYHKLQKERRQGKILLSKKTFMTVKILAIVMGTALTGLLGFGAYHFLATEPYKDACMELSDAYLTSDYARCIDSMEKIDVDKMNIYQKYMLATAFVKSENLNKEQKENILSGLTYNDSEIKLEYWIYLGRNNTEAAEDIAMQLSDDQLLLYAYMKEKASVEDDKELTGAEKAEKLEEITDKMEPLIEEYSTEDE